MMMDTEQSTDKYVSALNTFFRLKSEYEINKKKKCPNCGAKAVSTSFTLSNNVYKAVCVNSKQPCPLSIEIYNGTYASIQDVLIQYREIFEEVKQHIIQLRMKYLFWYGTSIGRTDNNSPPEENQLFVAEFDRLLQRFKVAKQQYMDATQQYHDYLFMHKEQAEEVNKLSNSITDIYSSLRESFPDLVLSWDTDRELLQDMIREQIRADDMKKQRSKLQHSLEGSVRYDYDMRMIHYVGGLDDVAFNTSGKSYSVRKFVLDEPNEETEPKAKKIVVRSVSAEEQEPEVVLEETVEEAEPVEEEPEETKAPKQKRCPKGERRNKKTGKCEPNPKK